MKHRVRRHAIERYLDGEASAAEIADLERAARDDSELRRALHHGRALVEGLSDLPRVEPSYDLVAGAERRLIAKSGERRRPPLWIALAAASAVAAGVLGVWLWPGTGGVSAGAARWMVSRDVRGPVWVERSGDRQATFVGDVVPPGSRVVTGPEGSVTLSIGEYASVTLEANTQVGVLAVEGPVASVLMERGLLAGEAGEGPALEVRLRGTLHVLRIEAGSGSVLHDGHGHSTVACARGEVLVDGFPTLRTGEVARLSPRAVARPVPAAEALHLSASAEEAATFTVRGRTNPGAEVDVGGVIVPVDDEGRFSATVARPAPGQPIVVRARDVHGRHESLRLARLEPEPGPEPEPATEPPRRDPRRDQAGPGKAPSTIEGRWTWTDEPG